MRTKNMKNVIRLVITACIGLASSGAYAVCGLSSISLEQGQERATNFVQDMKISKARGDLKTMNLSYEGFYENFLSYCDKQEVVKVCGYDCQLQLGEFHLFMASELNYYYSKSGSDPDVPLIKPEDLQAWVTEGVEIVQDAKDALLTQNVSGDLGEYLTRSAQFGSLLVRLYMAAGDNWYQSLSEARITRLEFLVSENIQSSPAEGSSLGEAHAFYEKASWLLQSAAMDVPDEPAYAGIAAEFSELKYALDKRLHSVDQGLLFLDIDPEEFTNISTQALRTEIESLSQKIGFVEDKIENMISEWSSLTYNSDINEINEQRRSNEISITQSAYRIAKMESLSNTYSDEISREIQNIQQQSTSFQYEKEKYNYEFSLKIKLQEMRDRKTLLLGRKEVDVLGFQKDSAERRLSDLRWLMNWEIAKNNIELQLSQFTSQIEQYTTELVRKENTLKQLDSQIASNDLRIDIALLSQQDSISTQAQIKLEQEQINNAQRASLEAQLCSVQNHLGYLSSDAPNNYDYQFDCEAVTFSYTVDSYQTEMCGSNGDGGLRNTLASQRIETMEDALCTVGASALDSADIDIDQLNLNCSGIGQYDLATDIFNRELELAELEIEHSEDERAQLKSLISTINHNFQKNSVLKGALQATTIALQVAAVTAKNIPVVTVCGCGLASGASTTIDVSTSINAAADFATQGLALAVDWSQYVSANEEIIEQHRINLAAIDNALEQANFAKEIRAMHARQALAEITGSALNYANNMLEQMIQSDMVVLDCENQAQSLLDQRTSSTNTYNQLLAQIKTLDYQSQNLDLALDIQKSAWQKDQVNIAVIGNSNSEISIEKETLVEEIASIDRLIIQTTERSELVSALSTKLGDLESDADAVSLARDELISLQNDKILALSDSEYNMIENVINLNETFTQGLIGWVDELENLSQIDNDLRLDVIDFKNEINAQVMEERQKILNQVEINLVESQENQPQKVFMASQEDLATLIQGIPQFVQTKRIYLQKANQLLVQLRNRVDAMVSLSGGNPLSLSNSQGVTYVKTRSDLDTLLSIVNDQYWSGATVTTQTEQITIPSECGLARELATNKRATFELSPYGQSGENQGEDGNGNSIFVPNTSLGCYSLWSNVWDSDVNGFMQNLLLLDMNLVVDFEQAECSNQRFAITHSGQGVVFKETSVNDPQMVPQLVVTSPRTLIPTYVVKEKYSGSLIDQVARYWEANFYLNSFLQDPPPNDPGRALPLMGLPLIGSYNLALGNPTEGCSYKNASYDLVISYASDPRLAN